MTTPPFKVHETTPEGTRYVAALCDATLAALVVSNVIDGTVKFDGRIVLRSAEINHDSVDVTAERIMAAITRQRRQRYSREATR
jgi:type 1 fimbria pilin